MTLAACYRGLRTLWEMTRVLVDVPRVERQRRQSSLHQAVGAARRRASGRRLRSLEGRARLRRAIAIVDARLPDGPNCVRRSLLEMSLDRGAANVKLLAGFVSGGGPKSGHAWLESERVLQHYDAVIAV
jgi:hypothetical protein